MKKDIEAILEFQLKALGIEFERQVVIAEGQENKYKFDFFISPCWLIECNGSTWVPSRGHTSGNGIERDYRKAIQAAMHGYHLLPFTTEMIENGEAVEYICKLLKIAY